MTTVQHGRRKGTPKQDTNVSKNADKFLILSSKEWQAIQDRKNKVLPQEVQQQLDLRKDKLQKHERCVEEVSKWGNTIVGKRNQRLNARKIREDQEEVDRKKLDLQEAEIKARKRKAAIEHAKKLQYYQTDRVKAFHSALLLSEVMKEREAQIQLKTEIENAMKNADDNLLKWEEQQRVEADRLEKAKDDARLNEAFMVRQTQHEQAKERQQQRISERVQDLEEGKMIARDVELYLQERDEKKKKAEEKQKLINEECDRHLQLGYQHKEQLKKEEKQREQEIKLYAKAKRKMAELRCQREKELFQEFQDHQNAMVDHLAKLIKQQVDDEDSRILQAVQERDAKQKADEEEKEKKRCDTLQEISLYRREVMRKNEQRKEKMKEDAALDLQKRMEDDKIFFEEQKKLESLRLNEKREVQDMLVSQIDERKRKNNLERQNDIESEGLSGTINREEEDEFQRYADAVIARAKETGRPVIPLIKAKNTGAGGGCGPVLEGRGNIRPSYQSQDKLGYQLPKMANGSAKNPIDSKNTDKRLGFVW